MEALETVPHFYSALSGKDLALVMVTLGLGFLALQAIGTVVYNLYFHPLAKYPGPPLAACTNLRYWSAAITGDLIPWIHSIHTHHGETVRIGPDKLSYTNPQAWKDIYGARKDSNPKDTRFYLSDINGRHGLNVIRSDAEHTRVRRIFAPAFSAKALKEQEPLFIQYADQLVANMRRRSDQKKHDLVKLLTCTTFDIMGALTFGEPLGLLDNLAYSPWVANMLGWIRAADLARLALEYPLLGRLAARLTPRAVADQLKVHFQHSVERVDRRVERGGGGPDIWGLVMRQPEGERMDREDMYVNSSVFMLAGTETTATLLSGLLYFLCRDGERMRRLCEEVRGGFGGEDELTVERLQGLGYMAACVEEALRLYPPLPIGPPREVNAAGNIVCGEWVPGKTRVSVAQYSAYRSPANFRDAESFVPERWLPGTGYDSDRKDALQPFSFGPRNCVGKNLAYHEMRIILAKLLWNFDFKLCPESEGWINQKSYTLWQKSPLWMTVKLVR